MDEQADRPPPGRRDEAPAVAGSGPRGSQDGPDTPAVTASRLQIILLMVVAVVVAASAWAFFRGILELSVGLLVVAGLGGWASGVLVRRRDAHPLVAVALAAIAWLLGLVLSWLLAMAILPGSSRTFLDRVQTTPFLDWMSPQFGFVEILGLIVYVSLAGYVARRGSRGASTR